MPLNEEIMIQINEQKQDGSTEDNAMKIKLANK